ncbi:hypothetical protein BJP48_30360 [Paenibacillus odorifer]|nr:hypothetical protein BJP48_30360 [Paenibacillus odorifer]
MSKHYECPKCENIANATDWNKKTIEVLSAEDDEIIDIESSEGDKNTYFICPACEKPSFGDQIGTVSTESLSDSGSRIGGSYE